jgi:hypothetical protein
MKWSTQRFTRSKKRELAAVRTNCSPDADPIIGGTGLQFAEESAR